MIEQYLEKILAWLESGTIFLEEQIPLYVQELLKWRMWNFIIWDIALLIFCIGFIPLIQFGIKIVKNNQSRFYEDTGWVSITIGSLGLLGTFIGFIATTIRIIQVIVAPRVYLIEYLKNLLS